MSFNRAVSTKEVLEALQTIKITHLPSYEIKIPKAIELAPPEFKIPSDHLNSFLNRSLFTTPVKQYANTSPENEVRLSRTPATLWLHIYSFLDALSLIGLTTTCKTLGVLANEPSVRNKLFCAQENQKREKHVAELIDAQAKQESRMELRERLSSAYDRPENLYRHFG